MKPQAFKIGLTMAGAVSAGSYTAGVIDYLLETLDLWEQAKAKNRAIQAAHPTDYEAQTAYDRTIPMHDVQLEVISGASAGGITGTLTAISLLEGIRPINANNPHRKDNKLYQSWVEMADTSEKTTLSDLLDTTDITEEVKSLLNSSPMQTIGDNALAIKKVQPFPPYVAKDLDLILTISNLRGIKYLINFQGKDPKSGTTITTHSGFFRYRFINDNLPAGMPANADDLYYVLDLDGPDARAHRKFLKTATISTGAFPIGLESQINTVPKEYLKRYTRYLFDKGNNDNVTIEPILPEDEKDMYEFDTIDGGLINNEPFGYTLKVLKEKCPEIEEQNNFAVIMVDPFPNYNDTEEKYDFKKDIFSIGTRMFAALRNQVMFKQDEIINALNENDRTRFLIAPTRRDETGERVKNPIACGGLDGFSGFLKKEFREHDFLLGRQNCQSFLRYYFAIEQAQTTDKFGLELDAEALQRFQFSIPPKKSAQEGGVFYFPIIPDLKVRKAFDNIYDTEQFGTDAELTYPQFPSITKAELDGPYKKQISNRIYQVLMTTIPSKRLRIGVKIAWYLGLGNRIYRYLMETIYDGLKRQGLMK